MDYSVAKITRKEMKPFSLVAIALIALFLSGCGTAGSTSARNNASGLTEDEKHRLYSAALAASDSPLDTDTFKDVCQRIGIFDADGRPNDQYMAFIAAHVEWATKSETQQFRHEINTAENARMYLKKYLPR
jgi:hypothetical protein